MEWPQDDLFGIEADLQPLFKTYQDGTLHLPDGLEELAGAPLVSGEIKAIPWVFRGKAGARQRGDPVVDDDNKPIVRSVTIRGVTIVQGTGRDAVFRRYVDWASVWAQLGQSTGRIVEVGARDFIDPHGEPLPTEPDTGAEPPSP